MSPSITPYSIDPCFWNTLHFPLCFSLLFLAAFLHCFDLPVTRSGRPRDRVAPFEWISLRQYVKIIAYRHRKLNYRIVIIIFSLFFFPSTDDARSTCTRMIYIEPWLHNVGGILNLYVTQVPGVMKHGRCNVIKYYTPFGETRFIPRSAWNIFSHLRYIYIVIYEGTIGIWCQTIVIDIRNEARFRGARFCATFNRIVELKKKKKSKNSSMFFYILRSKTWSKYCNISTFFSWFYTFSFLNNEKWQLILQNFFKAQQMG